MSTTKKSAINIEGIRKIQIEILCFVHELCVEHKIEYSLCGGTLIGAIRHKGYIPWDDDIDILLTRSNYNRLVKVINQQTHYQLLSMENQKDYYYAHSKLIDTRTELTELNMPKINQLGINIDIFVVDGYPDDIKERNRHIKKVKKYNSRIYNSLGYNLFNKNDLISRRIKQFIKIPYVTYCKLYGLTYWKSKLRQTLTKYEVESCELSGNLLSMYGDREIMETNIFIGTILVEFEGYNFYAMKNYDAFLKKIYGDYMELPPVEKRITHHNFVAYWKDGYYE